MERLTESQRSAIVNGMLVAAARFDDDAKAMDALTARLSRPRNEGYARVAEQFRRQAKESRELAEMIDAYEGDLCLVP